MTHSLIVIPSIVIPSERSEVEESSMLFVWNIPRQARDDRTGWDDTISWDDISCWDDIFAQDDT